jgi:hypothetical protein
VDAGAKGLIEHPGPVNPGLSLLSVDRPAQQASRHYGQLVLHWNTEGPLPKTGAVQIRWGFQGD